MTDNGTLVAYVTARVRFIEPDDKLFVDDASLYGERKFARPESVA